MKTSLRLLSALLLAGLCACTLTALGAEPAAASTPPETKEQRDARMAWFRAAKFGMFIHWGVYSVPGGIWKGKSTRTGGEWIMNGLEIPVAEYKEFPKQFNPVKFNADEWVALAKAAGMKYIVITAKHHDGFAMFKTGVDGFNIVDATPFKRDPLKELAQACHKQGIKLGFYYSQAQDWTHPGGAAYRINRRTKAHWDTAQDGSMEEYIKNVALPQVREILTNYGPVAVLWFDTPLNMTKEMAGQFVALFPLQPGIIVNNRLGGGFKGDTETPEQHIPPQGYPGRDWESCMTINDTWGYRSDDHKWKSKETLLRNLIDIASKGGNYLLNVGPTGEGLIPQPSVDRLREMGRWLEINGEAIYGTGPTAFGNEVGSFNPAEKDRKGNPKFIEKWEWRCTTKPGKLFVHLFKWPQGKFELTGMKGAATKAYLLADPNRAPLEINQKDSVLTVSLPEKAPDPIASVLCIELK